MRGSNRSKIKENAYEDLISEASKIGLKTIDPNLEK
jgi:hypothetical protein